MDIDSSLQTMNDMKKNIFRLVAVVALAGSLAACKKETAPYADEQTPTLSLTSPSSSFVQDQASIVLELSHFIHKDVVVTFGVEGIETEALDLPIEYTVEAGAVKKVIPIHIDEEKASLGNKTVGISITEVKNATLASSSVNLGINIEDVALVNVSATDYDANLQTVLTFSLSKAVTKDVVLAIAYDTKDGERPAYPAGKLSFDPTVTIPAGSKVGTLTVQAEKTGVEEGSYQTHFTVSNYGSNAKAGTAPDATVILNVGFQPILASTSDIYFQFNSGWWYVNYDKLHDYYFIWSEPVSYGDASDSEYVKAAMKRCREWILVEKNRTDWLSYWASFGSGYTSYVPHSCPQQTSEKIGYMGWPMIMINDGAIEDLDEVSYGNGQYHTFLFGFTAEMELLEPYQYALLVK